MVHPVYIRYHECKMYCVLLRTTISAVVEIISNFLPIRLVKHITFLSAHRLSSSLEVSFHWLQICLSIKNVPKGWEDRAPGAQNPDFAPFLRSADGFSILLLRSAKVSGAQV